ncbi:MAG: tetratricopeptide repeat protein [Sulfurimonas sp.]
MLKSIFFLLLLGSTATTLSALEVSLSGAKENFQNYSTLHVKDSDDFVCQEIKNDFEEVSQIVCAFSKQPNKKLKTIQNDFFKVEAQTKKNTFFLVISPFFKLKLYPMVFDISKDDSVYQADVKLTKHWMIIGYKDKLPYIKSGKNSDSGINFPFYLSRDKLPFVGGLDIDGKPVHIKKAQDVSDYLKIKEAYKDKQYDLCLDLIDSVQKQYPNSLFNAELMYYKIKAFNELKDIDSVIVLSKIYLQEYSSDENIPEVLSLIARANAIAGMNSDADYFFDRLFSEHDASPFVQWGYIYKGEMLEAADAIDKVSYYYEKALSDTSDVDIAATAAYKLAHFKILMSQKREGAEYIMKIINVKPDFFMKNLKMSMEMMYSVQEDGDNVTAAALAKALLDQIDATYDEYENLLKNRGVWLAKTDKKAEALESLNDYLKKYPDGEFVKEVKIAKDSLFFDTTDSNVSVRLNQYDELIETYKDDTIGARATYEKAKVLLENGMFRDVLAFKESILTLDTELYKDTEEIVKKSAVGAMQLYLENKECAEVLNLSSDYNITLSAEWDEGIYDCAMKGGDYLLSKKIASKNLKSKDLELRKKWLYRYIKVDFATGNYSDVIEASKELITLIQDDKESEYKDVHRYLFDTYQRLEQKSKQIEAIVAIEQVYGLDYKDIDRYVAVMSIGSSNKDDNMVIKYGKEVVNVQNKSKSYAQSPFVEFTLYQSYINKEDFEKALEIIKSLDSVELTNPQRARQKYLLGTVYSKLMRTEDAKKAYQEVIDADPTSAWAKLAKDAKNL